MFKKKPEESAIIQFHPETHKPILKCSICTGEQMAGFKDINTGAFTEVMLIKDGKDFDRFMEMYDLAAITKEY